MKQQWTVNPEPEPTEAHWVFCTQKKNNPVKHINVCMACRRRKNCSDLKDHMAIYETGKKK